MSMALPRFALCCFVSVIDVSLQGLRMLIRESAFFALLATCERVPPAMHLAVPNQPAALFSLKFFHVARFI